MKRRIVYIATAAALAVGCGIWGVKVLQRSRAGQGDEAGTATARLLAARFGGEPFVGDTQALAKSLAADQRSNLDAWTAFLDGDPSRDPSGGKATEFMKSPSAFATELGAPSKGVVDFAVYRAWLKHRGALLAGKGCTPLSAGLKDLAIRLGDQDLLGAADSLLADVLRLDTTDIEAMAWRGSFLTKRALAVESPIEKVDWVQKGMKGIDLAVSIDSTNLVVRNIRAVNYLSLPSFFQTNERGRRDVEFLLVAWKSRDSLGIHDPKARKAVLDSAGICRMADRIRPLLPSTEAPVRTWLEANLPRTCAAAVRP